MFAKESFIPASMRRLIAVDKSAPLYKLNAPDYDRVPLGTILIEALAGTDWRVLTSASIVERAGAMVIRHAQLAVGQLTPDGRWVRCFWIHSISQMLAKSAPMACRLIRDPKTHMWRHMIYPDEPSYQMLAAFELACQHRCRRPMLPTLLYRALGLEQIDLPDPYPKLQRIEV